MEISKISFIITCHGTLMTSFVDNELDGSIISKNGTFDVVHEDFSGVVPSRVNTVSYTTNKPIIEFEYKELDTSDLNVSLSTSYTCAGAPIYTSYDEAVKRETFISDVFNEITNKCPTNTLVEHFGHYGDVLYTQHKATSLERLAAHKIQKTFRRHIKKRLQKSKSKSKSKRRNSKQSKTNLMKYDNEVVSKMINKKYGIEYNDDDSIKIVMIITKNGENGCSSEEYILLCNDLEKIIETAGKLVSLSRDVAKKYFSLLERNIVKINGSKLLLPSITLQKLLILGSFIQETIGKKVPIKIYDFSCNTFDNLQPPYENIYQLERDLTPRELSIIRLIDNYLRKKDIAYGGKN